MQRLLLMFSISTAIVGKTLKTTRKNILSVRNKLNGIESIISKAVRDNQINHEDVTRIVNEAQNYHK